MDISKVTVRELLENKAACDAMNAIDPKILKSPMVKLVKGKTIEAVFNMSPTARSRPRSRPRSARPSPPSEHIWNKVKTGPVSGPVFLPHSPQPPRGGRLLLFCHWFVTIAQTMEIRGFFRYC